MFAGTTRITTKLEMPSHGGGGFEKFQYFYHPDHLGSTSFVTDQLGQVDQHYETFPFGEAWIEEATGQADKVTPYRFTGKEWDSETQLYYFGARYYDPRTSLWVSTDPALDEYLPRPKETASKRKDSKEEQITDLISGIDGMSSGQPQKTALLTPALNSNWRSALEGVGDGAVFEPKNLNLNAYALQNPLVYEDPDGEWVAIIKYLIKKTLKEGRKKVGGVYVIYTDNKSYVGSTTNLAKRFYNHKDEVIEMLGDPSVRVEFQPYYLKKNSRKTGLMPFSLMSRMQSRQRRQDSVEAEEQ